MLLFNFCFHITLYYKPPSLLSLVHVSVDGACAGINCCGDNALNVYLYVKLYMSIFVTRLSINTC